ncbi:MAG: hypothetical protein IPJ19_14405 [Planctomycetes bacterium]|nr:hypothetical protein [Planctomycetota bacterium]
MKDTILLALFTLCLTLAALSQDPQQTCPGGTIGYDMNPDDFTGTGTSLAAARQNAWDNWPGVPSCPACASEAHDCIQTRAPSGNALSEVDTGPVNGIYTVHVTYRPTVKMNQTCGC